MISFTSCQNAAYSNEIFFLCWVDFALEGSTISLSKCFTLRGHDTHIDLL